MRRFLAFALCWGGLAATAVGQSGAPDTASGNPAPESSSDTTRVRELETATYDELVARAKEAGLPTDGGVPELRSRIAQAWGVTLPPPQKASDTGQTLTIDSAQQAGLVTVDAPGDGKLLRLSGGIQVTLVDRDKKVTHIIQAAELWYDQQNEEMTARGQVVYTMVRDTSREVFRGDSLTFRLSDAQGVFYSGESERSRTVGTSTLVFRYSGDAIRRSSSDMVVLESGTITSSLSPDPNYRIRAKRIWVLAPGEWGLQDAVLYLGRVPVLYFPFFFQPGDDFFFNPVLTFAQAGDRRGTSLQTTTYLLGHKKKDVSPLSFLQMEDSSTDETNRVRRGLFMVRGHPEPSTIPSAWTVKYLADFYSNLGFFTGFDVSLPGFWAFKTLTSQVGLGHTRTVDSTGSPFTVNPFDATLDPWDQSHWNSSWLGSLRVPFRWGGNLAFDTGVARLSLEYFSDPLFYNDWLINRSENFSVFSLLGWGPAQTVVVPTPKASLQWSGALTWPQVSAAGSLLWDSKSSVPQGVDGDPENSFYLPSQMTLPQLTGSFSGTLWPQTGGDQSAAGGTSSADLIAPGTEDSAGATSPDAQSPTTAIADPTIEAPGILDSLPLTTALSPWKTTVGWTLKPTATLDTRFDESVPKKPGDSLWNVYTSRWTGAYDASLGVTTGRADGFWTTTDTFNLHQQNQNTWYLGPTAQSLSSTFQAQDEAYNSSLLSQTLTSILSPWAGTGAWRESNVQYELTTKLWEKSSTVNRFFDGTTDTVTTHDTTTQAVWYAWETDTSFKLHTSAKTTLPPLDPLRTYTAGADFLATWGRATSSLSADQTPEALTFNPWSTTLAWTPLSQVALQEDYQYDVQGKKPQSSTTTFTAFGFEAQYQHQQTTPYTFNVSDRQWEVSGPDDFLPYQLLFGYTLDMPAVYWWYYRDSLAAKVNFSWPINLQQFTQMPMTLTYTLTYKVYRFLDFTVSEGISNSAGYRYFSSLTDALGGLVKPQNIFSDLWDSVSFWDQSALRRTNFKMTSLTVGVVHYLDDWQIKLDYTGAPQLIGSGLSQTFQWQGTLTILVQWYPVPELKTQVQWDKDGNLTVVKNTS